MSYEYTSQTTPSCTADVKFSGDLVKGGTAGDVELCAAAAAAAHISEHGVARKSESESELQTFLVLDLNYPPISSRKSRQELTEAEKEERRMCRVLANREAARRTIRRKKAMQEELKRKAAELALENDYLKKNKELAAEEYNSLMNQNNNLRMQIDKIVKADVEETDDGFKSTPTSTASPTVLHNQPPKVPLVLSTVFPPSDGVVLQSGWQSISGITPQMPMSLGGFIPSDKLESSVMMNNPGTPLYIVSFPWQMQFRSQSNPFHPWPSYPDDHHKTSLVHECSTSTSKTTINIEDHLKATPLKVETTTLDSIDTMPRDFLHKADRDFLRDERASEGSTQLSVLRSKGLVQMTSASSPFVLPVIARQNESTTQNTPDVKVTYSAVGRVAGATTEMYQDCVACSNNMSADAILSADACRKMMMLRK